MRLGTALALACAATVLIAAVALATVTDTVDDKSGDSKGPVDIKSVTVTQKGLKLTFKVTAVKNIPKNSAPCVFVYAGQHNKPGKDGYAVGCYGKTVTTSDGGSTKITVKVKNKTVTYTLDPAAIDSPGKFKWQAIASGDGGKVFDKAPNKKPKSFDGTSEGGSSGDPNAPGGTGEAPSGKNPDGTCGPDHVPCPY